MTLSPEGTGLYVSAKWSDALSWLESVVPASLELSSTMISLNA
jgi:hypothetical protein